MRACLCVCNVIHVVRCWLLNVVIRRICARDAPVLDTHARLPFELRHSRVVAINVRSGRRSNRQIEQNFTSCRFMRPILVIEGAVLLLLRTTTLLNVNNIFVLRGTNSNEHAYINSSGVIRRIVYTSDVANKISSTLTLSVCC